MFDQKLRRHKIISWKAKLCYSGIYHEKALKFDFADQKKTHLRIFQYLDSSRSCSFIVLPIGMKKKVSFWSIARFPWEISKLRTAEKQRKPCHRKVYEKKKKNTLKISMRKNFCLLSDNTKQSYLKHWIKVIFLKNQSN